MWQGLTHPLIFMDHALDKQPTATENQQKQMRKLACSKTRCLHSGSPPAAVSHLRRGHHADTRYSAHSTVKWTETAQWNSNVTGYVFLKSFLWKPQEA